MQQVANITGALSCWAWLLCDGGMVSLLGASAFITSPLFVMWWKRFPTVSFQRMYRAHWSLRQVDAEVIPNQIAPTSRRSTSHPILPTASFPIQGTLVNAVGLTSVARRLQ